MGNSNTSVIGLTTTEAPFIEEAKVNEQLYIHQPYELYSEENHETWRRLYKRIQPRWHKYATAEFLQGVEILNLNPDRIPRLEEVNTSLKPISGFQAKAVTGYVPTYLFFDALRQRIFTTTITIRNINSLDYLPEPDIFHDVGGHMPMHTNRDFADVLVRFGELAIVAAEKVSSIKDKEKQISVLKNIIKAISRVFWFTVEFGLMRKGRDLKAYGSGLLSSYAELEHCINSPEVQRFPFQLEWVINQGFEIDHYQPLLFITDSFEHLFAELGTLRTWLLEGKLDHAAPGDPAIDEEDLNSFLKALL